VNEAVRDLVLARNGVVCEPRNRSHRLKALLLGENTSTAQDRFGADHPGWPS